MSCPVSNFPDLLDLTNKRLESFGHLTDEVFQNIRVLLAHNNRISDIKEYARFENAMRVFAGLNSIESLSGIEKMQELRDVVLFANRIEDLSPIRELTNLNGLSLSFNYIENIEPIAELRELRNLSLIANKVGDLSSLQELKNLSVLELSGNPISRWGSDLILPKLKKLTLSSADLTGVLELPIMPKLEILHLNNNLALEDIECLSEFPNLVELDVTNTSIRNLDCLADIGITTLHIMGAPIQSIEFLKKMPALQFCDWNNRK